VEQFGIRIASVDDLLDPYSVEPLERRPLRDEIRDRILSAWIDTREERPSHLVVQMPADQRRPDLDRRLSTAIRNDLEATYAATGRLRAFTRSERHEAWIGIGFLAVCLTLSGVLEHFADEQGILDGIAQGIVVLGWVALWRPAQRYVEEVSRRLNRARYRELSQVPIDFEWIQ
jgi:hypothetical protein